MVCLCLRDVKILAELAAHVAASRTHRQYPRPRKEMVERLLLDGIHGQSSGPTIAELNQSSAFVLADEAKSRLALSYVTVPRTEIAMQAPVRHGLPPAAIVGSIGCSNRGHNTSWEYVTAICAGK